MATTVRVVSRWDSNTVLFECKAPDEIPTLFALRYAVVKAVENGADLRGADLSSTIEVLEDLLAAARRGKISGLAWACRFGPNNHAIGVTGHYKRNPLETMAVLARAKHRLHQRIDDGSLSVERVV